MDFPTHSDAHINAFSQMKIVEKRSSLIIHKKKLKYKNSKTKLKYKGSRRYKEVGVTIYLHDVVLSIGVAVQLFMCEIYLKL